MRGCKKTLGSKKAGKDYANGPINCTIDGKCRPQPDSLAPCNVWSLSLTLGADQAASPNWHRSFARPCVQLRSKRTNHHDSRLDSGQSWLMKLTETQRGSLFTRYDSHPLVKAAGDIYGFGALTRFVARHNVIIPQHPPAINHYIADMLWSHREH